MHRERKYALWSKDRDNHDECGNDTHQNSLNFGVVGNLLGPSRGLERRLQVVASS